MLGLHDPSSNLCASACPDRAAGRLQAFSNTVKRMIEASGRGMWNADEDTLSRLKELYSNMQDQLEGV